MVCATSQQPYNESNASRANCCGAMNVSLTLSHLCCLYLYLDPNTIYHISTATILRISSYFPFFIGDLSTSCSPRVLDTAPTFEAWKLTKLPHKNTPCWPLTLFFFFNFFFGYGRFHIRIGETGMYELSACQHAVAV